MNPQIEELLIQAESLPDNDHKIAVLEEAVRLADMHNDEDGGFRARMMLTRAANFAGRAEKSLLSFAWCLARYDRNPEKYDPWSLMWHYKWIANDLDQFPQISREQIGETLEDLRRRYESLGFGPRVYAMISHKVALRRGDLQEAAHWYEKWLDEPRDELSDCLACELDAQAWFQLELGKLDEALRTARPLFEGHHSCKSVPRTTYADFLLPLVRAGRLEEAAEFHRKGYEAVRGEQGYLGAIAEHVKYLAATDRSRAAELFAHHLPEALESRELMVKFDYFLAGLLLLERLDEEALNGLELPEPVTREWLNRQVEEIAERFDRRNGTDRFRSLIGRERQALREAESLIQAARREREQAETEAGAGEEDGEWEEFRREAENGDPKAMLVLGSAMCAGEVPGHDEEEGMDWILRAAETGDPDARMILAQMKMEGEQPAEGWALLRENAEAGHLPSMAVLGWCLVTGQGVKPEPEEGLRLLRDAAGQGEEQAMFRLSQCCLEGLGCPPDPAAAETWLIRAAEAGNVLAMDLLGTLYLEGEDIPLNAAEGERWLRKAAEEGFVPAMHQLGNRLLNGTVLRPDAAEGEKWLRRAADADYPPALHELAFRLLEGDGLRRRPLEGEVLLRRAAMLEDPDAMLELAGRLLHADGVRGNIEEGFQWLSRAAEAGQPQAMFMLGVHLVEGEWIDRDVEEGIRWIRRAAEAGVEKAAEWLEKHGGRSGE